MFIVDLPFAPLAILTFLGMCLAVVACFAVVIFAALTGRKKLLQVVSLVLGGGLGLYTLLLLAASVISDEYLLSRGQEKHFCEVDCHLAYSVQDVQTAAEGPTLHYKVRLRTRFDENTIGPHRPMDAALYPNPRVLFIVDDAGKRYSAAETCSDSVGGKPLTTPLVPGESYLTTLCFDVPVGSAQPKLWVMNSTWPNQFLIGHENSFLHKKVYFRL